MKKWYILGLITGLIIASATIVFANSQIQALLNTEVKLMLNGNWKEFKDETTNEIQYPITYKGRTYLPLRNLANIFGANIDYESETKTIILETSNYQEKNIVNSEFGPQIEVKVSNIEQLYNEIGNNKRIILTSDFYNIESDKSENEVVDYWENKSLVIENVENMTIEGEHMTEITVDDIWSNVITFDNCKNIVLNNLKMGHSVGNSTYECEGAVLRLNDCDNFIINNCSLYGCGAEGIYAQKSTNIRVNYSKIYDCTYSGIWLTDNSNAIVTETNFFDSVHDSGFIRLDSSKIECNDCKVENIVSNSDFIDSFDYYSNGDYVDSSATFNDCTFSNNSFKKVSHIKTQNLMFKNCIFRNNSGDLMENTYTYNENSI